MGEVVVSGEEGMEVEVEVTEEDVVSWERFLPRMVLRVLLVEADDSTRQIISALLRKCSYRVAAVPDGLMAWETLKDRPHNIDLILTEVELPSISGYALLTLVMEHDVCKNIPVIMMSSKDSISMVLKCMLKGAADFLIKPVRRNELRNLWQHVWRRQTLNVGHIPQNSHVAQHKVEGTSENNAASNNSSDRVNSSQKDKECSEKGSDAESSSTIAYLEAECAHMQNMQGLSQLRFRRTSNLSNTDKEKFEDHVNSDKTLITPASRSEVFIAERSNSLRAESMHSGEAQHDISLRLQEKHDCAKPALQDKNLGTENDRENVCIARNKDEELDDTPNGAIDLIGAFDNSPKCKYGNAVYEGSKKFEFNPQLELSLRRFNPSGSRNHGFDERHKLNHSNASAFSLYTSKALQPLFPTSPSKHADCKDDVNKSPELSSNQITQNMDAISQQHGAALYGNQEVMTTLVIGQSSQAELARPSPQHGSISLSGLKLDNISAGYSHVLPSVWTSKLAGQREQSPFSASVSAHSNAEISESEQKHRGSDETANNYVDQKVQQESNKESVEEHRYGSAATVQSSSSSLCNGVVNNNSSGNGSFGSGQDTHGTTISAVTERNSAPEKNVNDGGVAVHDGFRGADSRRSGQREAALTKFRLKRKERCYEKKVRYQSRKRLAEQRPRVKGQFVRQAPSDAPISDANI